MNRRTLSAVTLLAAAACAPAPPAAPPAPPPITRAMVEESVQTATSALIAGDPTKAGATFTPNGVFINARGKIETQAAITAFWAEMLKTASAGKDLKLTLEKWGASGDMAYSLSRFTGGITAPTGYVLAVTQRQSDGTLKILAQVSIPDPPAKK